MVSLSGVPTSVSFWGPPWIEAPFWALHGPRGGSTHWPWSAFDGTFALRVRSGTLADLRGLLHGKVEPASDQEIKDWISEARSRAIASGAKKRAR